MAKIQFATLQQFCGLVNLYQDLEASDFSLKCDRRKVFGSRKAEVQLALLPLCIHFVLYGNKGQRGTKFTENN